MTTMLFAPIRLVLPLTAALLFGQGILTSSTLAAPAHQPARTSLKDLLLSTNDVAKIYSSGFRTILDGQESNKELASDSKSANGTNSMASETLKGRVTGYYRIWTRSHGTAFLSVSSDIDVFSSDSYSHQAFQLVRRPRHVKGFTYHVSSYSDVGDEAIVASVKGDGLTAYAVVLRRGAYLSSIEVAMKPGTVKLTDVEKLAAVEDQRIQSNG